MDDVPDDSRLLPKEGREAGKPLKFPSDLYLPGVTEIDWSLGWVSSPKMDGNRCLVINGVPYTSSMRPFRNVRLPELMKPLLDWSESERTVVDLEIYDNEGSHHAALSGSLNSYCDELPKTTKFYIFDCCSMDSFYDQCLGAPFELRIERALSIPKLIGNQNDFIVLEQRTVTTPERITALFQEDLDDGFEGSIIRSKTIKDAHGKIIGAWYKHGRATAKQQIGFKLKAYHTVDAQIIEVIQRRVLDQDKMEAFGIERKRNPDGSMGRVNNVDAYSLTDMVGAFKVRYEVGGDCADAGTIETEVSFAHGFDHNERRRLWSIRDELLGRWIEFTHMPHGSLAKARHGRLVRFREDLDV